MREFFNSCRQATHRMQDTSGPNTTTEVCLVYTRFTKVYDERQKSAAVHSTCVRLKMACTMQVRVAVTCTQTVVKGEKLKL